MRTSKELIDKVQEKRADADAALIQKAYDFAEKAHATQFRASGEPFFIHPIEVTWILAEIGLDTASIITGLLHDTVEDTEATLESIEKIFGSEVASLVDEDQ